MSNNDCVLFSPNFFIFMQILFYFAIDIKKTNGVLNESTRYSSNTPWFFTFGAFLAVFSHFWIIDKISEHLRKFVILWENIGKYQRVWETLRTFGKYCLSQLFANYHKFSQIFTNFINFSQIFQNFPKSSEILPDFPKLLRYEVGPCTKPFSTPYHKNENAISRELVIVQSSLCTHFIGNLLLIAV